MIKTISKLTTLFAIFLLSPQLRASDATGSACIAKLKALGDAQNIGSLLPFRSSKTLRTAGGVRRFRGSSRMSVHEAGERLVGQLDNLIMTGDTTGAIALIADTMSAVEIPYRKLAVANEARATFKAIIAEIDSAPGENIAPETAQELATALNSVVEHLRPDFTYLKVDQKAVQSFKQAREGLSTAVLSKTDIPKKDVLDFLKDTHKWLDNLYTLQKDLMAEHIADYIAVRSYLDSDFHTRFDSNVDVVAYRQAKETAEVGPLPLATDAPTSPKTNTDEKVPAGADKKWADTVSIIMDSVGMSPAYSMRNPNLKSGHPLLKEIMDSFYTSDEIQQIYSKQVLKSELVATSLQVAWDTLTLMPVILSRIPKGLISGVKERSFSTAFTTIFEGFVRIRRDFYLTDIKEFVNKSLDLRPATQEGRQEWIDSRLEDLAEKYGDSNYGKSYLECFARDASAQTRTLLRELYTEVSKPSDNPFESKYKVLEKPLAAALEAGNKKPPLTISSSRLRPTYYVAAVIDIAILLNREVLLSLLGAGGVPGLANNDDDNMDAEKAAKVLASEMKQDEARAKSLPAALPQANPEQTPAPAQTPKPAAASPAPGQIVLPAPVAVAAPVPAAKSPDPAHSPATTPAPDQIISPAPAAVVAPKPETTPPPPK